MCIGCTLAHGINMDALVEDLKFVLQAQGSQVPDFVGAQSLGASVLFTPGA